MLEARKKIMSQREFWIMVHKKPNILEVLLEDGWNEWYINPLKFMMTCSREFRANWNYLSSCSSVYTYTERFRKFQEFSCMLPLSVWCVCVCVCVCTRTYIWICIWLNKIPTAKWSWCLVFYVFMGAQCCSSCDWLTDLGFRRWRNLKSFCLDYGIRRQKLGCCVWHKEWYEIHHKPMRIGFCVTEAPLMLGFCIYLAPYISWAMLFACP
jgi:hypothetical protein